LIGNPLYRILEHRVIHYAITDKRVIVQKGVIGRDFTSIDFDKIERLEVNVNTWDTLFRKNTGTLTIFTTTLPYFLRNIPDPYVTFAKLQELSQKARSNTAFAKE